MAITETPLSLVERDSHDRITPDSVVWFFLWIHERNDFCNSPNHPMALRGGDAGSAHERGCG
jgi:hypothetical protein